MPPIPDTVYLLARLDGSIGLLGRHDDPVIRLLGQRDSLALVGKLSDPVIRLVGQKDDPLALFGKGTPRRAAVSVTCRVTDNGNSTWTYDFTVWNHMATATTDAEMYLNKFGLTVADTPTQEVPADWSDGASWHHNDPVGGGNWYGQLDGGEEDPDDLTLPVVWDSAWIGRIREGDALNGFRITLPALVPSFTWQAYASGYESVWPGLPAGPSKRSSFGAWFDALRPEVGGVSEEYWEYAWNGTVVPT